MAEKSKHSKSSRKVATLTLQEAYIVEYRFFSRDKHNNPSLADLALHDGILSKMVAESVRAGRYSLCNPEKIFTSYPSREYTARILRKPYFQSVLQARD